MSAVVAVLDDLLWLGHSCLPQAGNGPEESAEPALSPSTTHPGVVDLGSREHPAVALPVVCALLGVLRPLESLPGSTLLVGDRHLVLAHPYLLFKTGHQFSELLKELTENVDPHFTICDGLLPPLSDLLLGLSEVACRPFRITSLRLSLSLIYLKIGNFHWEGKGSTVEIQR